MPRIEHEPISSVPNPPTKHEEKKIFQSTYKLEKQFLPRHDETPEKAFRRKIQEISYESSRFRDVLNIMGIKISRNDIVKFSKGLISKVQAAGKFHFQNSSNFSEIQYTVFKHCEVRSLSLNPLPVESYFDSFWIFCILMRSIFNLHVQIDFSL